MKIGNVARQGDVLIRKVKSIPKGDDRKPRPNGILAYGEVTGHSHAISSLDEAELFEVGSGMFMTVSESGVSIRHQEHDEIILPAGNYEITIQKEYSPAEIRSVAD